MARSCSCTKGGRERRQRPHRAHSVNETLRGERESKMMSGSANIMRKRLEEDIVLKN